MKKLILLAVVAGLTLSACGSDDDATQRNTCLYDAVRAYPTWDPNNGPLLDHVDSCADVDKTEIRQLMTDFVNASNRNSKGN